jgi:hypothetical protein
MQCIDFEQVIESQPDGPLSASAAAHRDACGACRGLWSDLDAIRSASRELGTDTPEPPARIWTALRAQLAAEGLIREPQPAAGWFAGWFGTPRRLGLTGAYAAFLLAAAGLAGYTGSSQPAMATGSVSDEEASVAPELGRTLDGDLNRVIESLPNRDPALAASLRKNMGIVDNFIAVCEKSVREQPDNPVARDYLYGAYQQKAVLLATATDLTLEDR